MEKPEVPFNTFKSRINNRNWAIKKALKAPMQYSKPSVVFGRIMVDDVFHYPYKDKLLTLPEIAKMAGVKVKSLQHQVNLRARGKKIFNDLDEAIAESRPLKIEVYEDPLFKLANSAIKPLNH